MRVLVCGSRSWDDNHAIFSVLDGYEANDPVGLVVISGMARGADIIAAGWAKYNDVKLEEYPADWETHHRAAGPIRNKQMLDEGKPDVVWAFSDDIENSKGTKHMVQLAKRAGVPVYVVSRV